METVVYFEKYTDQQRHWRWRFKADNGRILADGGEGYVNELGCNHGIEAFKRAAAGAPVRRLDSRVPTGWVYDPAFTSAASAIAQALAHRR